MDTRLLEALDSGHVVLTAHRRQARQIRFRYATAKQQAHVDAWETPQVYGWDDWLRRVNAEIMWSGDPAPRSQRKLLSAFQEHVLWERIIHDRRAGVLDDLAGAARKARQAWGLIQGWRLPDPASAAFANNDAMAFSGWMREYHARCKEQTFMDHARLADTIGPALRARTVQMPAQIQLAGFDDFSPQQRVLLKTLENLGTRLGRVDGPRIESHARRVGFRDPTEEYTAAANWVRRALDDAEPGHIAVLVPELDKDRRIVERVFDDALMPGSALPSAGAGGRPYNLSVGPAFQRYPIVTSALAICELATGHIDFATLSSLLRSPFTRAASAEQPVRARFELWLRDRNLTVVRSEQLPDLLREFSERARRAVEHLVLEAVLTGLKPPLLRSQSDGRASQWAAVFKEMLDIWGWPGDVPLQSGEFQTCERLRSLLDELAGLDLLSGVLSSRNAVALLRRLCAEVAFQPQTPEVSVEILRPEQAYGLEFERIWVCGWHAEAWPRSSQPNPFVPIEWQRQHGIPRGTPEAELRFAKRLTGRLLQAAPSVVLSWPACVEDRPVAVSPLVAAVKSADADSLPLTPTVHLRDIVRDAARLETLEDPTGPALDGIERVGGGSQIFTLQSQCPFRAFAQLRLGANEIVEPAPGLDPMTRGVLVHRCLEGIWRRLASGWDVLQELIGGEHLEVLVYEVADEALTVATRRGLNGLTPRFRDIEHKRLIALVMAWLHVEAQRPPFQVASIEDDRPLRVGALEIRARADRTDRLADGRTVIIDYKTGQPDVADMLGERPREAQLPLYAIAEEGEVAAVLFGRVRTNDAGFVGVSQAADMFPDVPAFESTRMAKQRDLDWQSLFVSWRASLTSLADEYATGEARVDPRPGACTYCHLSALCRINDPVEQSIDA